MKNTYTSTSGNFPMTISYDPDDQVTFCKWHELKKENHKHIWKCENCLVNQ